jgi:methionyl aminopeptidase
MGKPKHPKVYSKNQIKKIREAGSFVAEVLTFATAHCQVGKTTKEIDDIIKKLIKTKKGKSVLGYKGYEYNSCISVDGVILHGLPSDSMVLKEGMIVGIDCPIKYKGMWADSAVNVEIGKVDEDDKKLNRVAFECLMATIDIIKPGVTIGEISKFQESYANERGYKVVKDFNGHGVGRELHEPPMIPYYYNEKNLYNDYQLKVGNVLAIEPTLVTNDTMVQLPDGWGFVNEDMSFGTSWEHTVVVNEEGCEILTKVG